MASAVSTTPARPAYETLIDTFLAQNLPPKPSKKPERSKQTIQNSMTYCRLQLGEAAYKLVELNVGQYVIKKMNEILPGEIERGLKIPANFDALLEKSMKHMKDPVSGKSASKKDGAMGACDVCHESGLLSSLLKCSQCKSRIYCGVKCQKKDWKELGHKASCSSSSATSKTNL